MLLNLQDRGKNRALPSIDSHVDCYFQRTSESKYFTQKIYIVNKFASVFTSSKVCQVRWSVVDVVFKSNNEEWDSLQKSL